MILSFSKQNILERDFIEKIAQGIKKHSFRVDNGRRWNVGMSIELYAMNPRNKGKLFAKGRIVEIDEVELYFKPEEHIIHKRDILEGHKALYDRGLYSYNEMNTYFLQNDMYKLCGFFDLRLIIWKLESIIARTKEELVIN
jgi:hypothetical protein